MKNLMITGLLTVLVIALPGCSKDDDNEKEIITVLETGFTNEEVIACANEKLSHFISLIRMDNIKDFGFNSSSELDQILLGTPFLNLYLTTAFKNDTDYDCFDKYIINYNSWKVPLMVDDDIRCFLEIYVENDSLYCPGGGGSDFAKRVNDCEKKYGIESEKKYLILEHDYSVGSFIMKGSEDDFNIYPIGDSLYFNCKEAYKVHNSFRDLFYSFRGCSF
jgi:hypothetical protein